MSLIAADLCNLESALRALESGGADCVHFDVCDGVFVPDLAFGARTIAQARSRSRLPFEAHLMVCDPERHIPALVDAGTDVIIVHAEASLYPRRTLSFIKRLGARAGIALNPRTGIETVEYVLDDADVLLLLTTEPDFAGELFIDASVAKVQAASRMAAGKRAIVEVDGGVTSSNIRSIVQAGAQAVVCGRAVFEAGNVARSVAALRSAAQGLV